MAIGPQSTGRGGGVSSEFAGKRSANVSLRPSQRVDASVEFPGMPSELSSDGSSGGAATDFSFLERRSAEWMVGGQDQLFLRDGLGALRGFVLVLSLYLVMGAIALGGLLLWHWLH